MEERKVKSVGASAVLILAAGGVLLSLPCKAEDAGAGALHRALYSLFDKKEAKIAADDKSLVETYQAKPTSDSGTFDGIADKSLDKVWDDLVKVVEANLELRSIAVRKKWSDLQGDLDKNQILAPGKLGDEVNQAAYNGYLVEQLRDGLAQEREVTGKCIQASVSEGPAKTVLAAVKAGFPTEAARKDKTVAKAVELFEANVKSDPVKEGLKKAFEACLAKRLSRLDELALRLAISRERQAIVDEALKSAKAAEVASKAQVEKEIDYLIGKDTEISPRVVCAWVKPPPALVTTSAASVSSRLNCGPRGLVVGGDAISRIEVVGLPEGDVATITAVTGEQLWSRAGEPPPGGHLRATKDNLAWDQQRNLLTDRQDGTEVFVYVDRFFKPKHRGYQVLWPFSQRQAAEENLRKSEADAASIVTRRDSQFITVYVETARHGVQSASVPLYFKKWSFETGGFFGVTKLVDEELVTTPSEDGKVRVTKVRDEDNYSQETGAFLAFYPTNYPEFGLGLGFSAGGGRAPSVFFGPVLRIRGFGDQGLLSFSAGLAMRQVRRFPDVEVSGDDSADAQTAPDYAADSAALKGRLEQKTGAYVLLSLGFQFGPIPAAPSQH